jgi:hypothetical protein
VEVSAERWREGSSAANYGEGAGARSAGGLEVGCEAGDGGKGAGARGSGAPADWRSAVKLVMAASSPAPRAPADWKSAVEVKLAAIDIRRAVRSVFSWPRLWPGYWTVSRRVTWCRNNRTNNLGREKVEETEKWWRI